MPTKNAQSIVVETYFDVDCTPVKDSKFSRILRYRSPEYKEETDHDALQGVRLDLYQATVEVGGRSNRHTILPDIVDAFAYAEDKMKGGGMVIEGWRTHVDDLEAFAHAILAVVAEGRRQGLFTRKR